jgi:hypothetical protein
VEALTIFAESVLSIVPRGFPAYVRIFHPARLDRRRVCWAEIAHANGKHAHAGMQLCALTDSKPYGGAKQPGVDDLGTGRAACPAS